MKIACGHPTGWCQFTTHRHNIRNLRESSFCESKLGDGEEGEGKEKKRQEQDTSNRHKMDNVLYFRTAGFFFFFL